MKIFIYSLYTVCIQLNGFKYCIYLDLDILYNVDWGWRLHGQFYYSYSRIYLGIWLICEHCLLILLVDFALDVEGPLSILAEGSLNVHPGLSLIIDAFVKVG